MPCILPLSLPLLSRNVRKGNPHAVRTASELAYTEQECAAMAEFATFKRGDIGQRFGTTRDVQAMQTSEQPTRSKLGMVEQIRMACGPTANVQEG